MNEQDNSPKQWVAPQEELRRVVVRYLLTYGDTDLYSPSHQYGHRDADGHTHGLPHVY